MSTRKLPGGPTQDEILAVSLCKLGLRQGDLVLDCGCGTGKVAITIAGTAKQVVAIDRRAEAIRFARHEAKRQRVDNIEFHHQETAEFLGTDDRIFDCAFIGGTRGITSLLPVIAERVRHRIVVNAVLLSTVHAITASMQELGIFSEAVHVQISRSQEIAGSLMFRPIDPVYILVGNGVAC